MMKGPSDYDLKEHVRFVCLGLAVTMVGVLVVYLVSLLGIMDFMIGMLVAFVSFGFAWVLGSVIFRTVHGP